MKKISEVLTGIAPTAGKLESIQTSLALLVWDPGYSAWCASMRINHPRDMEKACKEASLHAELWVNEDTGEEIWALVALREGWRVPDGAIEEAVWLRATTGRSLWAEPELLPDTVAPPPDDAFGPRT